MNLNDIQTILEYNYWGNHRILAAAKQVPPEQFLMPSAAGCRGSARHPRPYSGLRVRLAHTVPKHSRRAL